MTKPQQQKNIYDRLERLKSAIRNGSFTDEIEFSQLQKAVSEIEGTKKDDESTKLLPFKLITGNIAAKVPNFGIFPHKVLIVGYNQSYFSLSLSLLFRVCFNFCFNVCFSKKAIKIKILLCL